MISIFGKDPLLGEAIESARDRYPMSPSGLHVHSLAHISVQRCKQAAIRIAQALRGGARMQEEPKKGGT